MGAFVICLALYAGQVNVLQEPPIVHLQPDQHMIDITFGSKLLKLINTHDPLYLPRVPPPLDPNGVAWTISINNLGPKSATVKTKDDHFSTQIDVGETIHVYSNGRTYSIKR